MDEEVAAWFKPVFAALKRWFLAQDDGSGEPSREAVGLAGEREAERLLKAKGFGVLARNWRNGRHEIDLICRDREALVFVEVRARSVDALVGGYASIDQKKKRSVLQACRAYLAKTRPKPVTQRFDVVEVEHRDGEILVARHFENVPLFDKSVNRGR